MSSEQDFSFEDYLHQDDTGLDGSIFNEAFAQGQYYDSDFQMPDLPTNGFETIDHEALQQIGRHTEIENNSQRLELPTPDADVALVQSPKLHGSGFIIDTSSGGSGFE